MSELKLRPPVPSTFFRKSLSRALPFSHCYDRAEAPTHQRKKKTQDPRVKPTRGAPVAWRIALRKAPASGGGRYKKRPEVAGAFCFLVIESFGFFVLAIGSHGRGLRGRRGVCASAMGGATCAGLWLRSGVCVRGLRRTIVLLLPGCARCHRRVRSAS